MKKVFLFTIVAAMALVSACSKDDNGNKDNDKPTNTLTLGGEDYVIDGGIITYYGDFYSDDAENIYLRLYTENETANIYLDLMVPNGSKTLVPGKYNFGTAYEPFTILEDESEVGEDGEIVAGITGGSITVSKSGDIFTITFDLGTTAGKLTGKCEKALEWEDESDEYDSVLDGTITIAGDYYPITKGRMTYYPANPGEGASIELMVKNNDGDGLTLRMYIPANEEELVEGIYTFDDSYQPMTIWYGNTFTDDGGSGITAGTVTIGKSGETYTITFDLEAYEDDVTGTLMGTLDWEDGSEGDN